MHQIPATLIQWGGQVGSHEVDSQSDCPGQTESWGGVDAVTQTTWQGSCSKESSWSAWFFTTALVEKKALADDKIM